MNEKLQEKERDIKEEKESYNNKWDQTQRDKIDEIKKFKSIIDEQSSLISSYERMMEKEKREHEEESDRLHAQSRRLKDEVGDLNTKNAYLNHKLAECQDELSKIQNDIKNTFMYQEEKGEKMQDRVMQLERQLFDKEVMIYHLNSLL